MTTVVIALALNIAAFFYLQAWLPIVNLYRAYRQMRLIRAFRVAGLLTLVLAVHVTPVQAQEQKIWCSSANDKVCMEASRQQAIREADRLRAEQLGVQRDGDWNLAQSYSHGDDAFIGPSTTGYTPLDNGLRYVWNNVGKLLLLFALLALIPILNSKLSTRGEDYSDQMRREAEDREDHDYFDYDELERLALRSGRAEIVER